MLSQSIELALLLEGVHETVNGRPCRCRKREVGSFELLPWRDVFILISAVAHHGWRCGHTGRDPDFAIGSTGYRNVRNSWSLLQGRDPQRLDLHAFNSRP